MFGSNSPIAIAAYQVLRFLNPSESYCLVYLMGGMVFAVAVMLWRRRGRRTLKPEPMLRLLGSRKLWLHDSTKLDLKLYLFHGVLIMVAYGLFQGSSELWRTGAGSLLSGLTPLK